MAFAATTPFSSKSLLNPKPIFSTSKPHHNPPRRCHSLPHKPISAVHAADPSKSSNSSPPPPPSTASIPLKWTLESWKTKKALQLPEYPDKVALDSVLNTLETFPPIVFAGEARSLEEKLGQAAMGKAFLLQGGDCAESFKEFNANNIRDTFRVLLQMGVVLMFGGQMPVIKVLTLFTSFYVGMEFLFFGMWFMH